MAIGKDTALRLMLVDDQVNEAEAIVSSLRNAGIAVRPLRAESLDELAQILSQQPVDMVLAEYASTQMPFAEVAAVVKACAAAGAMALSGPAAVAKPKLSGEEQLAKLLEGRVAGEPQDCISLSSARSSQIIDKTAIVYRVGSTLWVNRPKGGAESLDDDDILVTKTIGSQLCSIDPVELREANFVKRVADRLDRERGHACRG